MSEVTPVVPVIVREGTAPVWVELPVNEPKGEDWVFVAADRDAEKDHPKTIEEAIDRIKPLVAVLFEKLSKVAVPPKEVELNLGLKLSATVGIFVAQSAGEASLSVKLKWTP